MNNPETIALSKPEILRGAAMGILLSALVAVLLFPIFMVLFIIPYIKEWIGKRFEPTLNEFSYLWLTHFSNMVKLFDNRPGLEITDTHIVDNASAASAGRIEWTDLLRMERARLAEHEGVTLFVNDPNSILENARGLRRMLLRQNKTIYLSPVHLSCDCIDLTCDELFAKLSAWQENSEEHPSESTAPDARYLVPYVEYSPEENTRDAE